MGESLRLVSRFDRIYPSISGCVRLCLHLTCSAHYVFRRSPYSVANSRWIVQRAAKRILLCVRGQVTRAEGRRRDGVALYDNEEQTSYRRGPIELYAVKIFHKRDEARARLHCQFVRYVSDATFGHSQKPKRQRNLVPPRTVVPNSV